MTNTPYQPAPYEPAPIERSQVSPWRRAALWIARAITWLVHAYVLIVEIILLLGFLLLLGGANPSSSFVEWVYRSLDRAMRPFRGIFEPIELGTTSGDVPAVIETSVIFAMIVYAFVLIAVQALLDWFDRRSARLDRQDEEYRRQQLVQQSIAGTQQPYQSPAATQPGVTPPPDASGVTPPPQA